jgi:peptidyl-Lys metalloendopeptidase
MITAILFAVLASAASVSAAPGLTLKVSGPDVVHGVENLRLVTELINTGDKTLKLLNDPRTILRKLPTNTFDIVREDSNVSPLFAGAKVKYTHEGAVTYGQEGAFTILAPGQSFRLTHDCTSEYIDVGLDPDHTSSVGGLQFYCVW